MKNAAAKPLILNPEPVGLSAIYMRVSSKDQGDRFSLPSQKRLLTELSERHKAPVLPEHIFVDKHTGKFMDRPDYNRMVAMVKQGVFRKGFIFVLGLDRLARNTAGALVAQNEFSKYGVKLEFYDFIFPDSPMGRFMYTNMAAVAQLNGEMIVEKALLGREDRLMGGHLCGGSPKYGYDYVKGTKAVKGHRVINEAEAAIVREMFEKYASGRASQEGIAADLNARGIFGKGGNGQPPRPWSQVTVRQILMSRTYLGSIATDTKLGGHYEIPVPRIISDELFEKAQARRAGNRERAGRPSSRYLLRGFIWCKCGKRCKGNHHRESLAYRCGHIERAPFRRFCFAPQVLASKIEGAVFDAIWQLLCSPAELRRNAEALVARQAKPTADAVPLRKERKRIAATVETTIRMMKDGLIEYAEGKAEIQALRARLVKLDADIDRASNRIALPPQKVIEGYLAEITSGPVPATYETRRPVLEGLGDLRVEYYEGEATITGTVPVRPAKSVTSDGKNPYRSLACNMDLGAAIPFILKVSLAA